jgi:hypothetical protein
MHKMIFVKLMPKVIHKFRFAYVNFQINYQLICLKMLSGINYNEKNNNCLNETYTKEEKDYIKHNDFLINKLV